MKTVLITGGSRGIGAEMVRLFSQKGYQVAFTYKSSSEEASALADATGAFAIFADSKSEEDVTRAVSLTVQRFGGIDCLINNAGIASFSLITDVTLDDWNNMISTNLTGAFLYSREVIKHMVRKKSGSIVNVTSIWGLVGSSCESVYSTAKAGLIGLTKSLAKELGPSGIRVNAIAPGVIDTDMNSAFSEDEISQLADDTPVGRIGKPCEVAEAALFLADDCSSFITGDVLNVSGGFVI